MGGCKSGWYESTFYSDSIFSVSQPKKLIQCYKATTTTTPTPSEHFAEQSEHETQQIVQISMLLGLLFLFFVMLRSCNKYKLDWYRLIAVYILGTIGVPVSIQLGPKEAGFNRVVGFGILVHNLAEIFILGHVWFGNVNHVSGRGKNMSKNRYGGIGVIMYVWLIMTLIAFLPQVPLFLILMIQGASCDWTLVATFIYLGHWMDKQGHDEHLKNAGRCYSKLGIAAAITHIVTIQPLFFMIATTYQVLGVFTIIFLIPTFILYIWFAAADKEQSPIIVQPNLTSNDVMSCERNELLKQIRDKETQIELKQRNVAAYNASDDAQDDQKQEDEVDGSGDNGKTEIVYVEKKEENQDEDANGKNKKYTYGDVVTYGLTYINPDGLKWFKILLGVGVSVAVVNSLIVFFAPCYIDMTKVVCDN